MLYITTGYADDMDLAQDLNSLAGKILRLTPEGEIPEDNPFPRSPIYSYGHRNPQGLAWHPDTKELFASEHGPTGEFDVYGHDEINLIVKGGNYGWPEAIGVRGQKKYIDPFVLWQSPSVPPSGMTFYKGSLFVATLRSQALVRIQLSRSGNTYRIESIERWFAKDSDTGKFGRLRDVVVGPEGYLYFLTSNSDLKGSRGSNGDKIYRVIPKQ
jgi:quinoprotein glucose dehydrogenase